MNRFITEDIYGRIEVLIFANHKKGGCLIREYLFLVGMIIDNSHLLSLPAKELGNKKIGSITKKYCTIHEKIVSTIQMTITGALEIQQTKMNPLLQKWQCYHDNLKLEIEDVIRMQRT